MTARLDAVVRGLVQGVGFRFFVSRHACATGLAGSAENMADGSVRVRAEGDREALGRLLDALYDGPPGARVDRVDAEWGEPAGAPGRFEIR